jgi:serine protease Do
VRGATDINVTLWDGRTFKGKIVGIDEATDIAILKIDATDLPFLKFGDSNELRVGDWVIAIGNPFGLGHTVTVGVVSAKGRSLGITRYEDFIQTDAAINPGNSGGPLINIKGEVVGINTAILNPSGMSVNAGIGFAIPSSLAKDIVPTLIAKGKVERAWLGVYIQEVTPEIAKQLGLKEAKGALVSDVIPGSPADKVGIKRGDVIIEFDGKKVETWRQLPIMVSLSPVNKKAKLKIIRDGKELEFEVVLAKMPEEQQLARQQPQEQQPQQQGLELKQFGITIQDSPDGPKVVSVEPGSPAQMAGIMPGDIIVEVNRKQVKNSSEIANILKDQKSALFLINREGRTIFVAIRVG